MNQRKINLKLNILAHVYSVAFVFSCENYEINKIRILMYWMWLETVAVHFAKRSWIRLRDYKFSMIVSKRCIHNFYHKMNFKYEHDEFSIL